jgi:MFS family permease
MSLSPPGAEHAHALSPARFASAFVLLALASGVTIGMNKVLVTLLALHLDAESWQIGLLMGAESLAMMLMSLPAGLLISRYGARGVYLVSSLGAMVLYPLIAYAGSWYVAAALLFVAGVCIPFRVVSMNTSWLERLPEVGASRGGWYRGTLMLGIGLLGPLLGNLVSARLGIHISYWITSGFFALMALYGYLILSRTRSNDTQVGIGARLRGMLSHLADPTVREVCIYDGVGGAVRGFFGSFIIIIAVRQFGWSAAQGVTLMVVEGAAYVGVLLLLGPLVARLGEARTYRFSHVSVISGLVFLGLSGGLAGLVAGAALQAVGQAFNHLVNVARLSRSSRNMGHVSGLFTMVGMAGGCVGATLGGLLSEGFLLQHVFLFWIPVWLATIPELRRLPAKRIQRHVTSSVQTPD